VHHASPPAGGGDGGDEDGEDTPGGDDDDGPVVDPLPLPIRSDQRLVKPGTPAIAANTMSSHSLGDFTDRVWWARPVIPPKNRIASFATVHIRSAFTHT
jgi:hypothetical protein